MMEFAQFCSAEEFVGAMVGTYREGTLEFGCDAGESPLDFNRQVLI